jgi:hypothetical protein
LRLQRLIECHDLMPQQPVPQHTQAVTPSKFPATCQRAIGCAVRWEWPVLRLILGDNHRLFSELDQF